MEEGDILVTVMTTPLFTSAILKASAIVTDLGGYLSHAAIVSREFGIPCVVGAEKATQILVDGQEVTVDGKQGVVYGQRC
jgi:pyruvate,water dikinase